MKKIWKVLLALLLVLVLVVGGYVAYVFGVYYRLEDNLPLEVAEAEPPAAADLNTGAEHRILSYNVGFGAYSDDYSFFMDGGKESRARSPEAVYENIGGALDAVAEADPDLVLLQEVDQVGTRSHHIDQTQLVREAMPEYTSVYAQNYDSPYLFWPLNAPHGANKAGQMTLSRYAITSALRRSLPIEDGFMKLVDLDRCYSINHIPLENGRELVLFNFHLSAYTSDGTIAEEQMKMLFADMEAEVAKGNYAIAGGDFNKDILGNSSEVFGVSGEEYTWAQPIPAEIIPQGLSIVAPFDPENPVATCRNADRPYGPDDYRVSVDGFIISDNVEVVETQVVDTGYRWSDHNPVYMDFILTEN